jgi:hypothetical protein
VAVTHQLPRLRPRRRQPEPVDDVVEPLLEELQQRHAGDPARPLGALEVAAELIFQHAVDALHLLLLAQLQAVAGELRLPRLAMLPGREVALLDRAFLRVAAFPLEEQLHRLAAAQTTDRTDVPGHYTRLLFGGRHPLCGIGVTSRIDFTSSPTVCSARIADSRPGPGPLHAHVERSHPDRLGGVAGVQRGLRRGERRALARALEADAAGARPRHHVALGVGDRDRGVVERRVDVRQPVMDDALLAALLEGLLALAGGAFFLLWCRPFGGRVCFRH